MTIAEDRQGDVTGVAADDPQRSNRASVPSPFRRITPALAGWIVAGCLLLGLAVFVLRPTSEPAREAGAPAMAVIGGPDTDDVTERAAADSDAPTSIEEQLAGLHGLMLPTLEKDNHFPRGTVGADGLPPEERFSWIAALSAAVDADGPQPQWDRGWSDPVNERFVRRRQPLWLNPAVATVTGEQGYPATHFVGVAGVGADAAMLPAEHPRAGTFGNERQVRADDVGDGLANTMLVAGVEKRLGSWAAGGEATVRGLTAEPYVGGPDGFGTGEVDGMHVLMADGSVRFVSRDTDAEIVRRLATMNDSLPLSPQVPEQPGAVSEEPIDVASTNEGSADEKAAEAAPSLPLEAAQVIADLAGPQDLPIDVLLAEPLPVYDVETALRQPILEFNQKDPVPVRGLLRLIEEMAAVPIRSDELDPESLAALDEPITLSLSEATLGDILSAALRSAGLTFEARPEGVFLRQDERRGE